MTIIGNPIYDRAEEASFFAEFFASFIGNGVYPNPSTGMQVLANSGMNLKIQPGKCFINGYFGLVEEGGEVITIEPADTNYNRIDRIIARWDLELRKIIPYVLKGTPASNPVVPSLTRNSNIYEIALADVAVKANTTTITQANITDRRLDTSLCGVVSGVIEQVDTATLFNQYQTWFEEKKQESADDYQEWFEGFTEPSEEQFTEWFEGIKGRLGEDVATNLQVQIDGFSKRYRGVSITAKTIKGIGKINKLFGTTEGIGKDVNLFNIDDAERGEIDQNTGINKANDNIARTRQYIEVKSTTDYVFTLIKSSVRIFEYNANKNLIKTYVLTIENNTFTTTQNTRYIRCQVSNRFDDKIKLQEGMIATEFSPYMFGTTKIICKNFDNTDSKIITYYTKILYEDDYIDFIKQKIVRNNQTEENIECTCEIIQYDNETTIYSIEGAELEIELTDNEAISNINKNIVKLQEKSNELNNMLTNRIIAGIEYATNEYINGQQVFRKKIDVGFLPNTTSKTIETGLSNINTIKIEGKAINGSGTFFPLPFVTPAQLNLAVSLYVENGSNIKIITGTNRSDFYGVVDLYYTK